MDREELLKVARFCADSHYHHCDECAYYRMVGCEGGLIRGLLEELDKSEAKAEQAWQCIKKCMEALNGEGKCVNREEVYDELRRLMELDMKED